MFEHAVLIDYDSTDRSVEICRELAPHWEVRTSKHREFCAIANMNETLEIEREFPGWKATLNTTEFIFFAGNLEEKLESYNSPTVTTTGVCLVAPDQSSPDPNEPLLKTLTHGHWEDRWKNRFLFKTRDGGYGAGRHFTSHPTVRSSEIFCSWLGWSPWNEEFVKRKLQIQSRIPDSNRKSGLGFHHFLSRDEAFKKWQEELALSDDIRKNPEYSSVYERLYGV